jgi:cysteine desulfuration protein SufE
MDDKMKKSLDEMREYLQETTSELLMMREMDNLEMYRMLTDIGKELEGLSEEERTDENYVYGCISNVYIADDFQDGRVFYRGVSDAHVVRGYLAVLIHALSGLTPEDIVNGTRDAVEKFARETDLKASLTPNRANAFGNIYKLLVEKAARHRAASDSEAASGPD